MNRGKSNLLIWKSGSFVPWQDATVPILSHGMSRGSAVFELFDVHLNAKGVFAFRMDKHLDRLFQSAELLEMKFKFSRQRIEKAVAETVLINKIKHGMVKIIAYYGRESLTDLLLLNATLDVAIFAVPLKNGKSLAQKQFISICFSNWCKISNDMMPIKSKACANYLNGMLVLKDAVKRGYDLGVLLDSSGYVAEGPTESMFIVKNNVLVTPSLDGILSGITRMSILEASKTYGISTLEEKVTVKSFVEADEIFTSKSTIKVLPVNRVEKRIFDNLPGPLTKKIMKIMKAILLGNDDKFSHWLQFFLVLLIFNFTNLYD